MLNNRCIKQNIYTPVSRGVYTLEHSDSGEKNSIRFDSIRQFDKMDACIGVMIFLSIAEFLFSNQ